MFKEALRVVLAAGTAPEWPIGLKKSTRIAKVAGIIFRTSARTLLAGQ
jgi:hypothetical protein